MNKAGGSGRKVGDLVDRGWSQLEEGDVDAAERSAKQAVEAEPGSAAALTLLGAVRVTQGEDQPALEHYRAAIAADPSFGPARLYAAELLLGWDRDHEEALGLIDQAIACAKEEGQKLDAMLLKAEALITLGDRDDDALAALNALPKPPYPDAEVYLRAAKSFLDLGQLQQADQLFRNALELEGDIADAYYGIGLIHESKEERKEMVEAFLKVRALDADEDAEPWSLDKEAFEALAEEAIAELPPQIKKRIKNIPIMVEEFPDPAIVADGFDPRMLGFFAGVPFGEQGSASGNLEAIQLYQRNIERACTSEEEIAEEVKITVLHETAHFFGLSDDDLDKMGLG